LGPFELRFEKPISLLSLTCKLTFNCDATSDLLQQLNPSLAKVQEKVNEEEKKDDEVVTDEMLTDMQDTALTKKQSTTVEDVNKLGAFNFASL
jgi:hypothetical protein